MLSAPDLVWPGAQIAERLHAHAGFREVDEVPFALPSTSEAEDCRRILTDISGRVSPWWPGRGARRP